MSFKFSPIKTIIGRHVKSRFFMVSNCFKERRSLENNVKSLKKTRRPRRKYVIHFFNIRKGQLNSHQSKLVLEHMFYSFSFIDCKFLEHMYFLGYI